MALIGPGGRPVTSEPAQGASGTSPHVKDSGLATFAADVLEASREVPVIVDFWAPWCGPCKTLGPQLEAAVNAANGAVKMVKINIDENPEIAQQLRIQSIPTVFAFKDGQPVDGFMGAIPESQIKAFVAALAGGAHDHEHGHEHHHHGGPEHTAEVLAVAAEALAAGDIALAAQAYGHVLQDEPGHPDAVAGLARAYLASGDQERARATRGIHRRFQRGSQRLAGAAPGRPEIHDHRNLAAGLQYIGGEGGEPGILDMWAVALGLVLGGLGGEWAAAGTDQCHDCAFRKFPAGKMGVQRAKGKARPGEPGSAV